MPVSFSEMVSNSASVPVQIGESTLTLEYYPEKITDEVYVALSKFGSVNGDTIVTAIGGINEVLATLIKSWDFYEDQNNTILMPIEIASFQRFSVPLKNRMLNAMLTDMRPNQEAPQA